MFAVPAGLVCMTPGRERGGDRLRSRSFWRLSCSDRWVGASLCSSCLAVSSCLSPPWPVPVCADSSGCRPRASAARTWRCVSGFLWRGRFLWPTWWKKPNLWRRSPSSPSWLRWAVRMSRLSLACQKVSLHLLRLCPGHGGRREQGAERRQLPRSAERRFRSQSHTQRPADAQQPQLAQRWGELISASSVSISVWCKTEGMLFWELRQMFPDVLHKSHKSQSPCLLPCPSLRGSWMLTTCWLDLDKVQCLSILFDLNWSCDAVSCPVTLECEEQSVEVDTL